MSQYNYSDQNAYNQQLPPGVTIHYQGGQQPYYDEQYIQEDQFVPQGFAQQGHHSQNGSLPQHKTQSWNQQYSQQGQPQLYQQNQQPQQQQYYQQSQDQFYQSQPQGQYQQYQNDQQDGYNQSQQQRTRSVGPENNYSYFVDKKGNYIPTSNPPMFTTGEPEGANYIPYSSVPRRARSVDPNAENESDLRFKFGGMAFVESEAAFYDVEGADVYVDLNSKNEEEPVRRLGDNYGLDFNESVYRGDQVEVEEGYQGYQAQKPRKHWTYAEDPFNPDNTYVDDLFAYYDPTDVVGDTIANHRVTVERELTEEERNNFCTEFIPTPGFLPQHRTEKPEPKEEGPICYSLSAKKELARGDDYRPPSRSQSAGPAQQGQKREVNLRNLLDDSAIQRQENVIQPAPWAPDSDYKQGRWQNQPGQLDPLNRRPQIPSQRPEWSQQVEEKKNVWSGKAQAVDQKVGQPASSKVAPERPPFWAQKAGQTQNQWQGAAGQQQRQQQQQQQVVNASQKPGNVPTGNQVSTNYTYYQQGQQGQQSQQQRQQSQNQRQQQNASLTVQRPGQPAPQQQINHLQRQGQPQPQQQQQQLLQRGRPQVQQKPQQQVSSQQGQQQRTTQGQPQAARPTQQQPQRPAVQQKQHPSPQQQQSVQQRTQSQPPQNRPTPTGSYQRTITYVNGKPVAYEEVSDRHRPQQQTQNYQSVVYVNGQPKQGNAQPQGGYTQKTTTYYTQGTAPQNGGIPQQRPGQVQGQNYVQYQQGRPQPGKPGVPQKQGQPAGWNETIPQGQLSNTQFNANGQYRGNQGQNVQYQRQVSTAANPHQQYQLIKQTETQVRQQTQPSGNLSRHTSTTYYKKKTLTEV
ncbi:unnamed protein product [Bursaphelenchus xylophilus]|uniref:(pine wood nematode) hypothetical protein n=1 Tax=Bursaphelenchus xylophilus TaxID=6326 RepID=A0A1I7RHM6_BURXY|nr:unnamed protein product [Bursaphelenchus xylophilus]CAG9115583.1 unnamed protein product [Bursaphelenchus xylophilus]